MISSCRPFRDARICRVAKHGGRFSLTVARSFSREGGSALTDY